MKAGERSPLSTRAGYVVVIWPCPAVVPFITSMARSHSSPAASANVNTSAVSTLRCGRHQIVHDLHSDPFAGTAAVDYFGSHAFKNGPCLLEIRCGSAHHELRFSGFGMEGGAARSVHPPCGSRAPRGPDGWHRFPPDGSSTCRPPASFSGNRSSAPLLSNRAERTISPFGRIVTRISASAAASAASCASTPPLATCLARASDDMSKPTTRWPFFRIFRAMGEPHRAQTDESDICHEDLR